MAVRRIDTFEELNTVIRAGRGYLYNDFGGRLPKYCPIHHVSCGQVPRMLRVAPGPLSVKKAWSESLEELIRWVRAGGKIYALCSAPSDPAGRTSTLGGSSNPDKPVEHQTPRPMTPAKSGEGLPRLRRASAADGPQDERVLDAVAAVVGSYRSGCIEIRTEADLQGHLFAALLTRLDGKPVPLHANLSLVSPREKIDLVVGRECILELKVEADYPGVSKPVVFPEDVWKDLRRLDRYVREGIVARAYFVMLDEDGAHARRPETSRLWEHVSRDGRSAHWLFLAFGHGGVARASRAASS